MSSQVDHDDGNDERGKGANSGEIPAWRTMQEYQKDSTLYEYYWEKGWSLREIGDAAGVTAPSILYWMREHDIPRRSADDESLADRMEPLPPRHRAWVSRKWKRHLDTTTTNAEG
jgi:hypothetical protein